MATIKTKFLSNNAVTDQKVRLTNAGWLRARNASDSADINILRVNTSNAPEFASAMSMAGFKINNLADPSAPQDAATKNYVDLAIQGLSPKNAVEACTSGVPLPAVTYDNGVAGVGATLTANANGVIAAIDGYTPAINDRILVNGQVASLQNGLYVVSSIGSGGSPFILTRSSDGDTATELQGAYTIAINGTVSSGHEFINTTTGSIIIGTTGLTFADYGTSVVLAGNGISKSGVTISTNNGPGLGYSGVQNAVLTNATVTTGSIKINGSNQVEGVKAQKDTFTLSSSDITNQYVDLTQAAFQNSVSVLPVGGPEQIEGTDYTLNYTGGANSKTRVSFAGDLATGGAAALVAGDILIIEYEYL